MSVRWDRGVPILDRDPDPTAVDPAWWKATNTPYMRRLFARLLLTPAPDEDAGDDAGERDESTAA